MLLPLFFQNIHGSGGRFDLSRDHWNEKMLNNTKFHIANSGAKIVLSNLPIGDLTTQNFADRDIFCAGRAQDSDEDAELDKIFG